MNFMDLMMEIVRQGDPEQNTKAGRLASLYDEIYQARTRVRELARESAKLYADDDQSPQSEHCTDQWILIEKLSEIMAEMGEFIREENEERVLDEMSNSISASKSELEAAGITEEELVEFGNTIREVHQVLEILNETKMISRPDLTQKLGKYIEKFVV